MSRGIETIDGRLHSRLNAPADNFRGGAGFIGARSCHGIFNLPAIIRLLASSRRFFAFLPFVRVGIDGTIRLPFLLDERRGDLLRNIRGILRWRWKKKNAKILETLARRGSWSDLWGVIKILR